MTTDDSINFLQTLAKAETWSEADDQSFAWKPPEENHIEVEPMKDGLPDIVSGDKFPKQYELNKRTPLVENFCRKGEVVLLTAASKMGKSWFFSKLCNLHCRRYSVFGSRDGKIGCTHA